MKIKHKMHEVTYFGLNLNVPIKSRFIATDENGIVYAHLRSPTKMRSHWYIEDDDLEMYPVAMVDLAGKDWEETLIEYDKRGSAVLKMNIGSTQVPLSEKKALEKKQPYFIPSFGVDLCTQFTWQDDDDDKACLKQGMIHLSAENATAHARALIKTSVGEA